MYANYLEIIQISAASKKGTVPLDNSGMQSAVTAYSTSKQILLVVRTAELYSVHIVRIQTTTERLFPLVSDSCTAQWLTELGLCW